MLNPVDIYFHNRRGSMEFQQLGSKYHLSILTTKHLRRVGMNGNTEYSLAKGNKQVKTLSNTIHSLNLYKRQTPRLLAAASSFCCTQPLKVQVKVVGQHLCI